jgi:hypothetical protein
MSSCVFYKVLPDMHWIARLIITSDKVSNLIKVPRHTKTFMSHLQHREAAVAALLVRPMFQPLQYLCNLGKFCVSRNVYFQDTKSKKIYCYYVFFSFKMSTVFQGIEPCLVFKFDVSLTWMVQGIYTPQSFLPINIYWSASLYLPFYYTRFFSCILKDPPQSG